MPKKSVNIDSPKKGFWGKVPFGVMLTAGILLCLIMLGLAVVFCRFCYTNLYLKNSAFALENLKVMVDNALMKQTVLKTLESKGITPSDSIHLPELNLASIRNELMANPRVQEARLRRIYPNTLEVEVKQRMPVAILHFSPSANKSELLIDEHGMILPRDISGATSKLPSIVGIKNANVFKEGEKCEDKGILAFLTFLKESCIREEGSQYEILNVLLDEKNDRMTLTLAASGVFKPGARVVMPLENISKEMDRLKIVVNLRKDKSETISYLNATYDNIPVRP